MQQKRALLIGNAAYAKSPLTNPLRDANAMAGELRGLGFSVTVLTNLTLRDFSRAVDDFAGKLQSNDLALFYYSGHGMQVDRENYLLPVEFEAVSEADVPYAAYPANRVRDKLERSGARLRLMILDACRDNPYKATRGGPSGLAPMGSTAEGTLIAFATGDNNTASDGPGQNNGLFTQKLLAALNEPGLELHEIFNRVKQDVYYESNKRQNPFTYDDVAGSFYFRAATAPVTPPQPVVVDEAALAREAWERAKQSGEKTAIEAFLREFPDSAYARLARVELASMNAPSAPNAPIKASAPAGPAFVPEPSPVPAIVGTPPPPRPSTGGITAAGATFPAPLYQKWFEEFQAKSGVSINYQAIGSGGGIAQLTAGTVDFAASDMPMTDQQMAAVRVRPLHFPTVLGGIVVTYNLPGLGSELKLTPEAVAGIFLGSIRKWNDPEIARANPGARLPGDAIVVVHRSDGSGTTFVFTDYLSKVSAEWKAKVGCNTSVLWPVGLGGKGDEGVGGLVKQTPGSIGYVLMNYAMDNRMPVADMRNAAGKWVKPSLNNLTAAASASAGSMPADFRVSITNASGAASWPIASYTWMLVPSQIPDRSRTMSVISFLNWMLETGQKDAQPLGYAPLPKEIVSRELKQIGEIR